MTKALTVQEVVAALKPVRHRMLQYTIPKYIGKPNAPVEPGGKIIGGVRAFLKHLADQEQHGPCVIWLGRFTDPSHGHGEDKYKVVEVLATAVGGGGVTQINLEYWPGLWPK